MNSRQPVEGLPEGALEVVRVDTDEVIGWVWDEEAGHLLARSHWRYASSVDGGAYVSPFGCQHRMDAVVRVAVVKALSFQLVRVKGEQ